MLIEPHFMACIWFCWMKRKLYCLYTHLYMRVLDDFICFMYACICDTRKIRQAAYTGKALYIYIDLIVLLACFQKALSLSLYQYIYRVFRWFFFSMWNLYVYMFISSYEWGTINIYMLWISFSRGSTRTVFE